MTSHLECGSSAAAFDQPTSPPNRSLSTEQAARPSHPMTSANPVATTGSEPDQPVTFPRSGTADNSSSRSTHTESSESWFRTAGKAAHTFHERTSPPGRPSLSPEISRPHRRAAVSSNAPASRESLYKAGRSLPLPCAASAAPAKAARETKFHPNTHSRFR